MTWKRSFLVVANVTATSDDLMDALKARADKSDASFALVVPATPFSGGRRAAVETLGQALDHLPEAGLDAEGTVGDADPFIAVSEAWDPKRYDEIIVSTLPMNMSKWMHAGLPERIAKVTGAPVSHVVSEPPKREHDVVARRADEAPSRVLGPLGVLGWG